MRRNVFIALMLESEQTTGLNICVNRKTLGEMHDADCHLNMNCVRAWPRQAVGSHQQSSGLVCL
jgi:hypothetical protein